jgi:hypothetical protein
LRFSFLPIRLVDVEKRLQLDDKLPLFIRHLLAIELFETVDAGSRNQAVQGVLFFELATVGRLMTTHFDLDSDGRLSLFTDRDLFVLSFDGRTTDN